MTDSTATAHYIGSTPAGLRSRITLSELAMDPGWEPREQKPTILSPARMFRVDEDTAQAFMDDGDEDGGEDGYDSLPNGEWPEDLG